MVQESTMICIDNSGWMRNGDFVPTRLQCQQDAANLILQCKLRSNPENAVGLLSMADTVQVLATMTPENQKLFMKLHQVQIKEESQFSAAIRVAHLALKHRQNRNHKMRIVLFVGSPMDKIESAELVKLAKKLKKEKVQADVVCFGEADTDNSDKLSTFVDTLNGRDGTGSHLIVVPSGSSLTEALMASPVCRGEDGVAPPVVAGAGGGGFEFGVDPAQDPELAMALRVSLEEQRLRQENESRAAAEDGSAPTTHPLQQAMDMHSTADVDPSAMTEEQQLEWALRMSMHAEQDALATNISTEGTIADVLSMDDNETHDDDERIDDADEDDDEETLGQLLSDPELLRQLVADLPGVDPNSQIIRDAVEQTAKQSKKDKADKKTTSDEKK